MASAAASGCARASGITEGRVPSSVREQYETGQGMMEPSPIPNGAASPSTAWSTCSLPVRSESHATSMARALRATFK
jgi:hypothetical protein